jgi:hypothetical protein
MRKILYLKGDVRDVGCMIYIQEPKLPKEWAQSLSASITFRYHLSYLLQ